MGGFFCILVKNPYIPLMQYAFLLGREPLLSLAELRSLFENVEREGNFALIDTSEEKIHQHKDSLWGTIKIGKIFHKSIKRDDIKKLCIEIISAKIADKKLRVGMDIFSPALFSLPFKVKDEIKKQWWNIRIVNSEQGRIKNATTIHEKLIEEGIELMIFAERQGFSIAETIWIQDIEGYSHRDIDRDRSMVVGMMPPKLAQIMINLATWGDKNLTIWDPFCGLGTTLIEALHGGFAQLIWSDIEEKMVQTTDANVRQYGNNISLRTALLDATKLHTYTLSSPTVIVTEWMLGKNFTSQTITQKSALEERWKLQELYKKFLSSAYQNENISHIALCLPFWNIGKDAIYLPALQELQKGWRVDLLSQNKNRYLIHMRPGQSVGREIVLLSR